MVGTARGHRKWIVRLKTASKGSVREASKTAILLGLIGKGATLNELMAAAGCRRIPSEAS
jgi:hypothetical protein